MVPKAGFWHNYGMPNCADKNAEVPPPVPSTTEPAAPPPAQAVSQVPAGDSLASRSVRIPIREIGGPAGPEPTRYGDWEKKGRCIDF